jgi:hypothetical protein
MILCAPFFREAAQIDPSDPKRPGRPGNSWAVEWFLLQAGRALSGGDYAVTTAPCTGDVVLCLKKVE